MWPIIWEILSNSFGAVRFNGVASLDVLVVDYAAVEIFGLAA